MFLKNRSGDITCDGTTWELMSEDNGDKTWRAEIPGEPIYRWRSEVTVFGPRSGILSELFDYSKRAGPQGWDPNLANGRVHKEYPGGYKILVYSSNPVFGGVVSGREFFEIRYIKETSDNSYLFSGCGIDEGQFKSILGSDFPEGDKSLTRAYALPGGGFYMWQLKPDLDPEVPQEWRYVLVLASKIGGWLPSATVNKASAAVLADAMKLQKSHLNKCFRKG